jgi:hyperosmotically inducible periplasmic protein
MKSLIISALIALAATFASVAFADPPNASDSAHAGAFVKDSVITAKIKVKLAEKHMASLTNIQVDTDNAGIVWLSGKVPTKDARDLAGMIAKDTDGVKDVHNKIVVQE